MKHIYLILIFFVSTGMATAQTGSMLNNFGAGNVVVRTNGGYVHNPGGNKGEYGKLGNSEAGMLSNFRGNAHLLVMINNHHILSCDKMTRPKFITSTISYDDVLKRQTLSLGYGQSTETYLPFSYTAIKGYWSTNLLAVEENNKFSKGINVSYSGYTKKYGIEISSSYTGKLTQTFIIHRKVIGNLLVAGGIENNFPKAGLEYLVKSIRISVHSTMIYDRIFPGFTTTLNM